MYNNIEMDVASENELVLRAKRGDKSAFEAIVMKYQKKIYFLCYRMTNDHDTADDLAQETFVKAYFNLGSFRAGEPFYPWLRRIAVNLTLNYLRDRKREISQTNYSSKLSNSSPMEDINNPSPDLIEKKIESAVDSLPAELKSVFVLRYHEKLSYKEISETLKVPIGTVMSRLNRAREKLKIALMPYFKGGFHET